MYQITSDQSTDEIIAFPVDANNNVVLLPKGSSVPIWAIDDTTLGTISPAADGLSAVFTLSGKLGTINFTVSAKLPDGTTQIQGTAALAIVPPVVPPPVLPTAFSVVPQPPATVV